MRWLTRAIIGTAMAGMTGAALMRDLRRARRSKAPAPQRPTTAKLTPLQAGPAAPDDAGDGRPLLSPTMFTLSHFSMLFVLLAMMMVGLMMHGIRRYPAQTTWHVPGGDIGRGRIALEAHGCGGCHSIRGIRSATGEVGPPLEGFARRMYIAGEFANTPDNLVAWLQDPQRYAPGTAMPTLAISESVARDMAAYLYARP